MPDLKRTKIEKESVSGLVDFDAICALLLSGEIAAIPTETVYGLAADSADGDAVAKIYAAKGRPSFNPLIVHIADKTAAQKLVHWNDRADKLAGAFWPGAMTLVMDAKKNNGIASIVSAGLPTLAIRCPAHPIMRAVLAQTGLNLAAPSANRSGHISATSAQHVRNSFDGHAPPILDGGICDQGLESTIIALRPNGWQILRPGPITSAMVKDYMGEEALPLDDEGSIEAPGQMSSHYAPDKPLRLLADAPKNDEFYIGFGAVESDFNLSQNGDLVEAAARLFLALHKADESNAAAIAIASIPNQSIGVAINDRLKRAAVRI